MSHPPFHLYKKIKRKNEKNSWKERKISTLWLVKKEFKQISQTGLSDLSQYIRQIC